MPADTNDQDLKAQMWATTILPTVTYEQAQARIISHYQVNTSILLDLIAELRAQHYADQCECGCEQWYECEPCSHISLCPTQEAAVRAEARLREVQGE